MIRIEQIRNIPYFTNAVKKEPPCKEEVMEIRNRAAVIKNSQTLFSRVGAVRYIDV